MPASRTSSIDKQTKSLRQGRLSFATLKRTASASGADPQKKQQPIPPVKILVDEKSSSEDSDNDSDVEIIEAFQADPVELKTIEDTPAYKRLYKAALKARDGRKLIHRESQTKTHEILRVFDLSYQYGPCVGVTRLERWERAKVLGLNPPTEVKEILLSKEGLEDSALKQCVFYEEEV